MNNYSVVIFVVLSSESASSIAVKVVPKLSMVYNNGSRWFTELGNEN